MDRRTFLLLAAAAASTTGCTDRSPEPGPATTGPGPADDPDDTLRQRVAQSESALIAAYRDALSGAPALAPALEPIMRQHAEHLDRVAPGWTPPAAGTPSPVPPSVEPGTSSATASQGGSTSAPPVPPADPADLLSRLAAAESAARDQRVAACDAAVDPALARELCLIAASEAQHAAVLADAQREAAQ